MQHASVLRENAGLCCRAGCLLSLMLHSMLAGDACAELLGMYPHRNGTVQLSSELCEAHGLNTGQLAQQTVAGHERQGCWGFDRAGNPVVTWRDGSELVLDAEQVRPPRRTSGVQKEGVQAAPRLQATATSTAAKPYAAAPPAAVSEASPQREPVEHDFDRPAWCPEARFPHERLVCADAELADRDLHLASLWWPYRRTLSLSAQAWHKSDYFRRLKACGADKACVISEQEAQMRRYRQHGGP